MITIYVTYSGDPGTRFDRAYYVSSHLPLVMRAWEQYGLESCVAFFPAKPEIGTIAIAECRFRDEAAAQRAFGSPESASVMSDIRNFTDVVPSRSRAVSLRS